MKISNIRFLRKIIIPIFKTLNPGDITIKHHYTKSKIILNSFKHKGYWFYGKKREKMTMELFKQLIKPNDTVIEVGGHIGYITSLFSSIVGALGKVYVFEPGENNLPYIKKNVESCSNIVLIEKAISDSNGIAKFYIEDLSGQNNSLLSEYEPGIAVKKASFVARTEKIVEVETVTLDSFCRDSSIFPHFVKIDIEGAELMAINGMHSILQNCRPIMMIEITENFEKISKILEEAGYKLFNPDKTFANKDNLNKGNTFCLHSLKHQEIIKEIMGFTH